MTEIEREVTRITAFQGEYRFLSNFWPVRFSWSGEVWPSSEHCYQAHKTLDNELRDAIRRAPTPGKAKRLGGRVPLRPGWNDLRVAYMFSILQAKFEVPDLRCRLLATGEAELIEGNRWGDTFWGLHDGYGRNTLGRILMTIRRDLRHNAGVISGA